jgi:hypothetical protein
LFPCRKSKKKGKNPASCQLSEMLKHASFFTRSGLDILKRQTMKPASALSGINYTAVQPICFSYYMHFSAGIFFFFFCKTNAAASETMNAFLSLWKKMSERTSKHTAKTFESILVGNRFRAGWGLGGCKVSKSKLD